MFLFSAMRMPTLLVVTALTTLFAAWLGAFSVSLPAINAGQPFSTLSLAAVVPLTTPIMLGWSTNRVFTAATSSSVRRPESYVLLMVAALAVTTALITLPGIAWTSASLPPTVLRNTLLYLALFLVCACFTGYRLAAIAPLCYVLISAIFGRASGAVRPWALPLVIDESPRLLMLAAGMLALAAIGFITVGTPKPSTRRGRP